MDSVQSIQVFVAINLPVVGLSHFIRPQIWVDFFEFLHSKHNVGNIINALIALGMGSIILAFHFIWKGFEVLITLYGLSQVIKGLVYLNFPSIGIKSIGKVTLKKANTLKWTGLIMVFISTAIFINLIQIT